MIKLLLFVTLAFSKPVSEKDSIGIETVDGKVFVIHRVDDKETLYAISKRYNTTVDAIKQYNSTIGAGLEVGQIIKVPYTPKAARPANATLHKVAAKETLFSIAKQYGVSMDELKQWNNITENSIAIGQELIVKKGKVDNAAIYQPVQTKTENKTGTHTVAEKETMYSITRQYGISVEQLREWNNLEGNELKIGQTLIVAKSQTGTDTKKETSVNSSSTSQTSQTTTGTTTKTKAQEPVVKQEPVITRQEPVTTKDPVTPKQEPGKTKQEPVTKQETPMESIRISETVKNGDEVVETGLAELIEGTEGNRKYLALHRSAPVGTILKVRNEMNNREVFVRVMGKLPETAFTDKLVIRVSKSAYDRLGAIDAKFRVEVTYYK
jgi:LysM repeat protein